MNKKFTRLTAALALLVALAIPLGMWGQDPAPANTVLWAEDFSGYAANAIPSGSITNSHTGTTVYGDVTLTYACGNGTNNGATKVYNETSMNSTKPELLIAKSNGTFVISNISTGGAIDLTLTYKENYNRSVLSSSTEGVTISTKTFSNQTSTYTITTNGASSLNLTFTNTNGSNVRVDDFSLIVKTAGSGGTPTPSLSVSTNSIAFGQVATGTSHQETFTVTYANLTPNQTLSVAGFEGITVDPSTISVTEASSSQDVTVTYAPTAAGSIDDIITVSSSTNNLSETVAVTGSAIAVPTYNQVTNVSDLHVGDVIILGCAAKGAVAGPMGSNVYFTKQNATITSGSVSTNDAIQITLGGSEGAWTLTTSEGLIGVSSASMNHTGSGTTEWTISISNGAASINGGSSNGNIQYNASSPRFKTYTSSQTSIEIYKLDNPSSVATPTISLASGTYHANQSVTLSCTTEGASIYYTLDGNDPTSTSTPYNGAITINGTCVLKAIAILGEASSGVATANYILTPLTPVFNPAGGTYTETQTVSIACETNGATIYYTTDGSDPTTSSSVYSEALSISQTTTVKAMAVKSGMTNSEIATAEYTITPISNISDITEAGNYIVRGTVVAKSTRGFVLGDGTGYIYYYKGSAVDQNVGDIVKISGQVSAPTNYKVFQYTNTATITTAETSNYQAENPIVLTGSQMDAVVASTNTTVTLSNYVQYEGTLSVNNNYYNITNIDGTTTAKGSISYPTNTDFASLNGKTVKVIGYYVGVSSNQYYNTMIGSIEEVTTTDPTLTANPNSLSFTYAEGATEVPTKSFTLTGSNLSDDAITISLPENSNFEMQGPSKSYGRILYLTPIEGAINQEITVRLKENLDVNNYEDEITIDWQGDNFTVALTGTVTAPEAPHVTWDLSIASYDEVTDPDLVTWSSNYATMTNATGTGSTAASNYLGGDSNNRTSTRFYANNVLTITPASGYAITSVVFTATTTGYASELASSSWTNATATADESTVTVTPENGAVDISAVISGTCGFTAVTVYYEENTSAPVWSALPTPAIAISQYYEIDLTEYVTGAPAPTFTLTTNVSSDLYAFGDGEFVFSSEDAGSYVFTFTATNSEGSASATLTITVIEAYTIYFFVNGEEFSEMDIPQGNALGTLPTPTENIPEGFTFVGWMESPVHPYYHATDAPPTMVDETTGPEDDMMLDAVFCIASSTTIYTLSNNVPVDGDKVILAAKNSDNYYAMYNKGDKQLLSINNDVVTTANPSDYAWNVTEASYGSVSGLALVNNDGIFHMNVSSFNVTSDYNNGIFEFNESIMHGLVNNKYLKFDGSFGVSGDIENACDLYFFKGVSSPNANTDYTTLVVNHANNTTIADNAAETLYGIHYINGHVLAGNDVTNGGKLVVNNGGKLDMFGNALNNSTAANFVIEDGGEAYLSNNNNPYGTVKKNITGYGTGTGNWYMLTHPLFVANLAPSDCGMITDDNTTTVRTYDLYSWDPTDTKEWQNYRKNTTMVMTPQAAYLYANVNDVTLTFVGQLRDNQEDVDMDFTLYYNESSDPEARGWNLKGNPTVGNAAISTAFYKLNNTGDQLNLTPYDAGSVVGPMEGFFVKATENNQPFTVTPTTTADVTVQSSKGINVDVISNNEMLDRAIVSFNGGMLGKFYLSDNTSRLYFTEGGQDYAIMPSANEGEMPVSFKASKNGTYTISVEPKNVEMTYLHLIDNRTGADVDLLATPNYSFEARTTDYASRFRLVFNANNGSNENSIGSETFAYYNGSEWVISNMGEATLQVVDVMGRVLSTETVNGNATINLNQTPGVYMLRLVNGDSVKVQKVVVR